MAFNYYIEQLGQAYANRKVRILDSTTAEPAIIKSGVDGVIVSTSGEAVTDSDGTLRVYIDTSKSWRVRVDGLGVTYRLTPLFLKEIDDGSYAGIVDNEGNFKMEALSVEQVQAVKAILESGAVVSVGGFSGVVTKENLGIDQVNNTSDMDKPVSTQAADAIAQKYSKPSTGIPKSDLSSSVQTSLNKADSALQVAPVTSVNGKSGVVNLSAQDVGLAYPVQYTEDQMLSGVSAPAGVIMTEDSGQVIIGEDGTPITIDGQPCKSALALGDTLGEVLAVLAENLRTTQGTPKQVLINFDTPGVAVFYLPQDISTDSSPTFKTIQVDKICGNSAAPTITTGAGAGTGSTSTAVGSDLKVKVTVTTGTGCASGSEAFTIEFSEAYASLPIVDVCKYSETAILGPSIYVDEASSSGSSVTFKCVGALSDSTQYSWVIGFTDVGT